LCLLLAAVAVSGGSSASTHLVGPDHLKHHKSNDCSRVWPPTRHSHRHSHSTACTGRTCTSNCNAIPSYDHRRWPWPSNNLLALRGGAKKNDDERKDETNEGDDDDKWRRNMIPTPYSYTSPSALDAYGGSPQIRNAAQAASGRYGGTIVIAAVASDGDDESGGGTDNDASVVCCSLRRVRKGVRSSRQQGQAGGGIAVHVVSCADPVPGAYTSLSDGGYDAVSANHGNAVVALAASGLRPDLDLLLNLLRSRSVDVWDRYDVPPGPGDMAESVSQAFLTFLGYDRDREAGDGADPVGGRSNSRGEGGFKMSRPFGLDVLLFGVGWNRDGSTSSAAARVGSVNGASILSVGPSGMVRGPFVARAAGRGADLANELLRDKWRVGLDVTKVRQICIDIIKEIAREEMGVATSSDDYIGGDVDVSITTAGGWEVVCETLSTKHGLVSTCEPIMTSEASII